MRTKRSEDGLPVYAISTVHCSEKEAPQVIISRSEPREEDKVHQQDHAYSSIHFRDTAPCISYRVLGSRLSLTCLNTQYESTVLKFGSAIQNVGIHDDGDNLMVYVFLRKHVLYSMLLLPVYLSNPRAQKSVGWINEYSPPSFLIKRPSYMHTVSAADIVFALADGGLLRLSQGVNGYTEHIFSDTNYINSLKSILPWSGRPRNLTISMVHSASQNLLFTASVDAKLKVWNLLKGQLLSVFEISSTEHPLNYLLPPEPANLLALREQGTSYTLVTYCPQNPGIFRVFRGRKENLEEICHFSEQQPSEGLWRVFDMTLDEVNPDGGLTLNILWKLDTLSLLQTACIQGSSSEPLWQFAVSPMKLPLPSTTSLEIEDYVFTPERFSKKAISEALSTLTDRDQSIDYHVRLDVLREHISQYISDSVQLEVDSETGNTLSEKYSDDIRLKYLKFAQIVTEIDRSGEEPHSLIRCPYTGQIFISQTSKVSFIRKATAFERLIALDLQYDTNPASKVLQGVIILKDGLSPNSWYQISSVFRNDCLTERTLSPDDAMFVTYEKTIENQVSSATSVMVAKTQRFPEDTLRGLEDLLPIISLISLRRPIDKILGVDAYVAEQRDSSGTARLYLVYLIAYIMFVGCTWTEATLYHASTLFIKYLQAYRQLLLLSDTLTYCLDREQGDKDEMLKISRVTLADDPRLPDYASEQVVLHGLATIYAGDLPSRDLLERILVYLINVNQAKLAVHFSTFVNHTSFASYLKARSLLLDGQHMESATLFARTAYALIHSNTTRAETRLETKLQRADLIEYNLHVAALCMSAEQSQHALRFCESALIASHSIRPTKERLQEIHQRVFSAAISAHEWTQAYSALSGTPSSHRQENIRSFAMGVCESSSAELFSMLPFLEIMEEFDLTLERTARNMIHMSAKPSYHKILYAHRIKRADYRGAASILYHRLQSLKNKSHVNGFNVADHLEITETYLCIINALRCLPADDAWFIAGAVEYTPNNKRRKGNEDDESETERKVTRQVFHLVDIKKAYDEVMRGLLVCLQELS